MYKKSKEYWKKKAQEENAMIENERRTDQEIEDNQLGWDRRIKESSWLLKGVSRIDDSAMGNMVEKVKKEKSRDVEMFVTKTTVNVAESGSANQKKKKQSWKEYLKSFVYPSKESLERKLNGDRYIDHKLRLKEKYADKMVEREARRNRRQFLREGAKTIRVLQQIGLQLKRNRQPAHHQTVMEMADYEPPTYAEEKAVEDYCADNLRTHPEQITVPAPIEILRSNAEVLAEEKERRTWKISSRYHLHLGAEKLFPLKSHPVTTTALFEAPHFVYYPEEALLPDREAQQKQKDLEDMKFAKENLPIYKIKKAKLNMSRQQYKMPRPGTAPAATGYLLPWQSSGSVCTRNSGHAAVHARRPGARINKQFTYGRIQKDFHDSVDSLPARQQLKTPLDAPISSGATTDGDEYSAAPSELTEDTTQMYRVDYKLTEDPASLFYNPPAKMKAATATASAAALGGFGLSRGGGSVFSRPFTAGGGGYKSSSVVPLNNNFMSPGVAVIGGVAGDPVTGSVRPYTADAAVAGKATAAVFSSPSVLAGGKSRQSGAALTGNRSVQSVSHFPETASMMGNSVSWAGGATGGAGGADYYTVDGGQSMTLGEAEESQLLYQQSQLGWQSDDAVRSNYLSVQSTNPGVLVPVKMQRYRKMRKIDTRRVKGGFHLLSKDSKERKLDERKKFVKQRLKDFNEGLI